MTDTDQATDQLAELATSVLVLRDDDHVGVATRDLQSGTALRLADGSTLLVTQSVPRGHKLALSPAARMTPRAIMEK